MLRYVIIRYHKTLDSRQWNEYKNPVRRLRDKYTAERLTIDRPTSTGVLGLTGFSALVSLVAEAQTSAHTKKHTWRGVNLQK